MKHVHREHYVPVTVSVTCPFCTQPLGVVDARTGSAELFECCDCEKTYRVEVRMKRRAQAELDFFELEEREIVKLCYDGLTLPV